MARPSRRVVPVCVVVALTVSLGAAACSSDDAAEETSTSTSTSTSTPAGGGTEAAGSVPSSAPVAVDVSDPAPVGEVVDLGDGVGVELVEVRSVDVTARGPGEVAGPGVAVTVRVTNDSGGQVDLSGFAVNATGLDGTPATGNDGDPSAPLAGTLAAGGSGEGVYVFSTEDGAEALLVEVQSADATRVALFSTAS